MRTPPALQAGDELQQNPVQPIAQAGLVPVRLPGMLLALVGNQSLHVVVVEGLARQFQVTIPQGFEDGRIELIVSDAKMVNFINKYWWFCSN